MSISNQKFDFATVRDKERRALELDGDDNAVGLAFSGGGIRSATFCLGILQGLAQLKVLDKFHFLSTVSGGGYIGGWLSLWLKREDQTSVEEALAREGAEAPQVQFLREYSNYLTPRRGLLSNDSWTAITTYTRNLLLNLLVLIPVLIAFVSIPTLVYQLFEWSVVNPWGLGSWSGNLLAFSLLLTFMHFVVVANVALFRSQRSDKRWWRIVVGWAPKLAAMAVLAAAFFISAWLGQVSMLDWHLTAMIGATGYLSVFTIGVVLYRLVIRRTRWAKEGYGRFLSLGIASAIAGFVAGSSIWTVGWIAERYTWTGPERAFFGTSLIAIALVGASMIRTGIAGSTLPNAAREWWARLGALTLKWSSVYVVLALIAYYGPSLLERARADLNQAGISAVLGWLVTTLAGVAAAARGQGKTTLGKRVFRLVAWFAPTVFVIGLLLAAAVAATALHREKIVPVLVVVIAGPVIGFGLSRLINVNEFSMHAFYRNRLVRAYLGASRAHERKEHPFTGFDPKDDQPLFEVWGNVERNGPYPIINSTLNLVHGKRLAWQQRKAASFVLAPMYSGYELSGNGDESSRGSYRSTKGIGSADQKKADDHRTPHSREGKLTLGTALATSGAAATPNMGHYSSSPLAFLMTMLNVRLGWWLGNPSKDSWSRLTPRFGLFNLMAELFSLTSDEHRYVYLSDGGHFENLGIYELVRRRCRFIIACDAAGDPDLTFADLGNAIGKCRTDFGVDIHIDLRPLERGSDATSKWHSVVGTIHYPADPRADETDEDYLRAFTGTLVYIKPTLTGDEPADIKRYAVTHAEFPHQSTADQWFSEAQFESYRKLGQHTARTVLEATGTKYELQEKTREKMFVDLTQHWTPPAPTNASAFTRLAANLDRLWADIQSNEHLRFLDYQMYEEWAELVQGAEPAGGTEPSLWLPKTVEERRAGFYVCQRLIQLMENVYVDLELEEHWDHPDNRGWINLFNHWVYSGMFRVTWAVTASSFGARFQTFCARRLGLSMEMEVAVGEPTVVSENSKPGSEPSFLTMLEKDRLVDCLSVYRILKSTTDPKKLSVLPLSVVVRDLRATPNGSDEPFRFPVGFALADVGTESVPGRLVFFRIQNHLRNGGLGREALKELAHKKGHHLRSLFPFEGRPEALEEVGLDGWFERYLSASKRRAMKALLKGAWDEIEHEQSLAKRRRR